MDSEITIKVTADILEEHFGPVVAAVGHVLLQRGPLRLQELLVYLQGQEEIDFPQLRNAMLVMLQHRLLSMRPQDESYVQIYAIEKDEILHRLRFPQYLEYVHVTYGEKAFELLLATLKYGRVSKSQLLSEVAANTPANDMEELLERLVKDRILRPERGDARAEEARKRKREESNQGSTPEVLYRYDRINLNLCVYKNFLCRVVEEQVDEVSAQVMMVMLTSVTPDSGDSITENAVAIDEILKRYQGLFPQSGRDPLKIRERLRNCLEILVHKEKFLRQRTTKGLGRQDYTEWWVDTTKCTQVLRKLALSQLIRDRFGAVGLRIFNLLQEGNPPQKREEQEIFNLCMIPLQEGREILQAMVRHSVLQLQQVARSSDGAVANSVWLYYVDLRRVMAHSTELVLNAILNLRIRFRAENTRIMPLESRSSSLTAKERQQLRQGRRGEDLLERAFLVLDAVLLVANWKVAE